MTTNMPQPFPDAWSRELAALDDAWQGGDAILCEHVGANLALWRERLNRPATPDEEMLDVVDEAGARFGWFTPRWFCHLTGLRHRVAHIFLTTPQDFLILQMRAHDKAEWPSLFDTTVGGHLKAGQDWLPGALAEIEEEVGLPPDSQELWLVNGHLRPVGEPYNRYGVGDGQPPMRNRQVNQTYWGELTAWGLANLRFADGEVAGVYLCHPEEARRMVENDFLIAPGIKHAFWRWWNWRY